MSEPAVVVAELVDKLTFALFGIGFGHPGGDEGVSGFVIEVVVGASVEGYVQQST